MKLTILENIPNGTLPTSKLKALEDLDALGEHLLKENLQSTNRIGHQFYKFVHSYTNLQFLY